jgi:hypothetical protein
MKVGFANWNATKIRGSALKSLVFSKEGILVFEGRVLTFVSCPDFKSKTLRPTTYPAEHKAVFISKEFDKLQQLEDNVEYIISFDGLVLNVYKETIYNPVLSIVGESL